MRKVVKAKRGQVTILIIVAVIVVIGIGLFFLIRGNSNNSIPGSSVATDAIAECVSFITETSHQFVVYQGGYVTPPSKFFNFSPTFFPYYYYEGQSLIPTLRDFESEMGAFVDNNVGECFDTIANAGFDVSYSDITTDVSIDEDGVTFVVNSVVTLSREGSTMRVDVSENSQYYESKLFYLYDAAAFFVADQVEDSEFYCISCITRMAEQYGFKFYIFPLVEDVYFITVFTEDEDPLVLNFVAKYKPGSESTLEG